MTIEDKVRWESALYWYNVRRPRGTQYQTGPRHGQQLADVRKRARAYGDTYHIRLNRTLRAFDTAHRATGVGL